MCPFYEYYRIFVSEETVYLEERLFFLFVFFSLQKNTHHLMAQSSKAAMRHMEWQEWGRGRGSLTDHRVSASLQPKRSTETKDYRKYAGGGGR